MEEGNSRERSERGHTGPLTSDCSNNQRWSTGTWGASSQRTVKPLLPFSPPLMRSLVGGTQGLLERETENPTNGLLELLIGAAIDDDGEEEEDVIMNEHEEAESTAIFFVSLYSSSFRLGFSELQCWA